MAFREVAEEPFDLRDKLPFRYLAPAPLLEFVLFLPVRLSAGILLERLDFLLRDVCDRIVEHADVDMIALRPLAEPLDGRFRGVARTIGPDG